MPESKTLYPPSPPDVPEGLTDYADSFAKQQNRVLTGLFVFLIFYFAMLVLFAMVGVWCALALPGNLPAVNLVGAVLSTIFFLFLVKGFFKRPAVNREMYVEVHDDEHPLLFDFIQQLCHELGAPFPNRVYVCPDVIAEYSVSTSIFNLFTEPKRDLLIGMGLVNYTNLSEFKAVLAHEFGQFCHLGRSKSSCAVVQNIVFDLIEGEDFFDRFLKACRHNPETDRGFQIKMLTWPVVYPVTWILEAGQGVLWLLLKMVALPGRAMAWEQEFHADLVAVSAAGSDALTHGLLRVRFGMQCFNEAIDELVHLAEDHDLYSNDMYLHQDRAAAIVRWKNQRPDLGLPPALPQPNSGEKVRVFDSQREEYEDEDTPPMWRGHPASADREENAKEHFVPALMDHRSPWILFDNVDELKEHMSYEFYRVVFHIRKNADLTDAREIQGYIDKEYPEITYPPQVQATVPAQEIPRIVLESGELKIPKAVESISLVPLEEPIPVVSVLPELPPAISTISTLPSVITMSTLPVVSTMPAMPGLPAERLAPSVDELKGETISDESIQVVEGDAIEPETPPRFAISVKPTSLTPQPSSSPIPTELVDDESFISASAEDESFVVAEAVPAEAVAEATPASEPISVFAAAIKAELSSAVEPVQTLADVVENEAPIELEPTLEVVASVAAEAIAESVVEPPIFDVPIASESVVVPDAAVLDVVVAEPAPVEEPEASAPVLEATTEPEPARPADAPPTISLEVEAEPATPLEPVVAAPVEVGQLFSFDPAPVVSEQPTAVVPPATETPSELPPELSITAAAPESEVVVAAEAVPEVPAAEPEPVIEVVAPVVVSEPPPMSAASVAFGSAVNSMLDAVPDATSESADGSEAEVFTLDEVEPVSAAAGAVLALDADASGSGKSLPAVPKAEALKPVEVSKPVPTPAEQEPVYTLDADDEPVAPPPSDPSLKPIVKIGIASLGTPAPKPDTGATPAPRAAFGSTPIAKPDANATPMPRPAFGSGSHPPLVVATVAETVVPAEGRRPAVRITFVKPGEKSPIKK